MTTVRRRRTKRAERSEETRQALLTAAALVVGRYGYAEASIARITQEAKIAHGTFYNYFESRQDLFDQLLPAMGRRLLEYVTERVAGCQNQREREELRFLAYFEFLQHNPEFYRILNEAEVFTPEVHRSHVESFSEGYVRALHRAWEQDELEDFDEDELEPLAYILLAARSYLSLRYIGGGSRATTVPAKVFSAYRKLIRSGLFKDDEEKEPG